MRARSNISSFVLLGSILCVFLIASCSGTTGPDDSSVAPKSGSQLVFQRYGINTQTRFRDPLQPVGMERDTVSGQASSVRGLPNVFAFLRGGVNDRTLSDHDTLHVHYEQNGDISLLFPGVDYFSSLKLDPMWLRLPIGSKIDDTVHVADSVQGSTPSQFTYLRGTWTVTFEGPDVIPVIGTSGDPLAAEMLSTVKVRIVQKVEYPGKTVTDNIILWYAPKLAYFVQENHLISETSLQNTGWGRTLIEYSIAK